MLVSAPGQVDAASWPASGGGTAICSANRLEQVAGMDGRAVVRIACHNGWALASAAHSVELFKAVGSSWTLEDTDNGSGLDYAPEDLGVPLEVLEQLGSRLGPGLSSVLAAAKVVSELVSTNAQQEEDFAASDVIEVKSGVWLVTGFPKLAKNGLITSVDVYRWSGASWSLQATVPSIHTGELGGGGTITAVSLTGSVDPDFALGSSGADTNWFALISKVGGAWHAVPFDYQYRPATGIDVRRLQGRLVETEVNSCGCAAGPETYSWETFRAGLFQPAPPPGPAPKCDAATLSEVADPDSVQELTLSRVACADGWALGVGSGTGYSGQAVGLFEQQGAHWVLISLDDGSALGLDPGIYDFPLVLLRDLAGELGSALAPEVASASLRLHLDGLYSPSLWELSGVIGAGGEQWLIASSQPAGSADADISVYQWTGAAWAERGTAAVNDQGSIIGLGGWYQAVSVPGSTTPDFLVTGSEPSGSPWTAMVSVSGAVWIARTVHSSAPES
jgi:hypothetical protein